MRKGVLRHKRLARAIRKAHNLCKMSATGKPCNGVVAIGFSRESDNNMAIYKRGDTYWYEFQFNGARIQESAQTKTKMRRARSKRRIASDWRRAKPESMN